MHVLCFCVVLSFALHVCTAKPCADTTLYLHYEFDEGNGTALKDTSCYNRTGGVVHGGIWRTSTMQGTHSMELNSSANGYISLPTAILGSAYSFTIACFVKFTKLSAYIRLWDIGDDTSHYVTLAPYFYSAPSWFARYSIKSGAHKETCDWYYTSLTTGVWYHYAVVYDYNNTRVNIIRDGVVVATNNLTLRPLDVSHTFTDSYIGRSQFSSDPRLAGYVDDFRIYARALSTAEVGLLASTSSPTFAPTFSPTAVPTATPTLQTCSVCTDCVQGYLSIFPLRACAPVHITLKLDLLDTLYGNDSFTVSVPGFTTSMCTGSRGSDLSWWEVVDANRSMPSVKIYFYEGTASSGFSDSYMKVLVRPGVDGEDEGVVHKGNRTLFIDASYGIQYVGGLCNSTRITKASSSLCKLNPANDDVGTLHYSSNLRNVTSTIFYGELNFFPGLQNQATDIALTLSFPTPVYMGDLIYIRLPYFSSSINSSAVRPYIKLLHLASNAYFNISWHEGTSGAEKPRVRGLNSTLAMQAATELDPGTKYTVRITRTNGLLALCSSPVNSTLYSLTTSTTYAVISEAPIPWVSGVGSGCLGLGNCNGNGQCDWCTGTCICVKGYGAPGEVFEPDLRRDCSQRVCRAGNALGPGPRNSESGHHRRECSNNGFCDRSSGRCRCFDGFEGAACERRACPNRCSDRGYCASMRNFARLTNNLKEYPDFPVLYGCICDSSWPVGNSANQTQQAEFFGSDCSLRRCPSGDNPNTLEDETDCEDRMSSGTVGQRGNLCHVDCANRGVCDYSTGVCQCFDGAYGRNCAQTSVLAVGSN